MMARYVDKNKILSEMDKYYDYYANANDDKFVGLCIARTIILSQSEEDVAPVIHAKWENGRCTNCHTDKPIVTTSVIQGYIHQYQGRLNYCPNCGAKMEE